VEKAPYTLHTCMCGCSLNCPTPPFFKNCLSAEERLNPKKRRKKKAVVEEVWARKEGGIGGVESCSNGAMPETTAVFIVDSSRRYGLQVSVFVSLSVSVWIFVCGMYVYTYMYLSRTQTHRPTHTVIQRERHTHT
jgi:hypothetical protein